MSINQSERNLVELVNMEFYSHHGHFKEEQVIGNKFIVSFSAETDVITPAMSDDLKDALNYQELYNLISEEMAVTSRLMENVAGRILNRVKSTYPQVKWAQVSISKLNPPVGGKVEASRVVMSY
ncbi:MAG: dihydroneopterin aldolase [Rikenellaceae bacterium]